MIKPVIITIFIQVCVGIGASSQSIEKFPACPNGLQVILKTQFLGSCVSQSGNGLTGNYYRYTLQVENRSGQALQLGNSVYFSFYSDAPFSIPCFKNNAGESTSFPIPAQTFQPYALVTINMFDLMFYENTTKESVLSQATPQVRVGFCNAIFKSSESNISASNQPYSNGYNATKKSADDLVKKGKHEEARQVWERYKEAHPEDAKRAEQQQLKIIKELGQKNDQEQKARNKQEIAAGTAEVGLMTYLGGFIYNGAGKDKPKNIQASNSWRFNFTMGYSFALMPTYTNSDNSSYIGTQLYENLTVEKGSVATLNFDLGLQFWPYYGKNAGVGLIANGFGGYMPLPGSNSSYNYNYGGQVYFGLPSIKLTGIYLMGDRGFDKLYKFTSSIGSSTSIDTGTGASAFNRLMVGPRISFGPDEFKTKHLELYYIMENYPNMKLIKSTGVNVTYYAHNRIKIYGEYLFNAARIGTIKDGFTLADDLNNNGSLILFGVVRTIDVFAH